MESLEYMFSRFICIGIRCTSYGFLATTNTHPHRKISCWCCLRYQQTDILGALMTLALLVLTVMFGVKVRARLVSAATSVKVSGTMAMMA